MKDYVTRKYSIQNFGCGSDIVGHLGDILSRTAVPGPATPRNISCCPKRFKYLNF